MSPLLPHDSSRRKFREFLARSPLLVSVGLGLGKEAVLFGANVSSSTSVASDTAVDALRVFERERVVRPNSRIAHFGLLAVGVVGGPQNPERITGDFVQRMRLE